MENQYKDLSNKELAALLHEAAHRIELLEQKQVAPTVTLGWKCSCGYENPEGNFCQNCGKPKVEAKQIAAPTVQPALVKETKVAAAPAEKAHKQKPAKKVKTRDRKVTEVMVGRTIMGLMGSLLVFLALFLIGKALYEVIPPIGKALVLFVVSLAFAIVGVLKMKKGSSLYPFFATIAGCGIGAFYISILVSFFYFKAFGGVVAVILMVIWAVAMAVLARTKSQIFTYVCYLGITLSTVLCGSVMDLPVIGIVSYVVSVGVLFWINFHPNYRDNVLFFIHLPITAVYQAGVFAGNHGFAIVLLTVVFVSLGLQGLLFKIEKKDRKFQIISNALSAAAMFIIMLIGGATSWDHGFDSHIYEFYMLFMIALTFLYYKKYYRTSVRPLYEVFYYVTAVLAIIPLYNVFWCDYIGLMPFIILLLVLGMITKSPRFKITAGIYTALITEDMCNMYPEGLKVGIIGAVILGFIVSALIDGKAVEHRFARLTDKIGAVLLFLYLMLFCFVDEYFNYPIFFLGISAVSFIINRRFFTEKNKVLSIVGAAYNGLMMIVALPTLALSESGFMFSKVPLLGSEPVETVLLILLAIGLYCNNLRALYSLKKFSAAVDIYTAVKMTILAIFILIRLDAVSYVYSFTLFGIAAASLGVGFACRRKCFRIYGLITAILAVLKLTFVDFMEQMRMSDYASIVMPLVFLSAGVVCFLISFIYVKMEGRMKKEKQQTY